MLLCSDFYDLCVCVCEPADQLYRKDARYRGYLIWYIFRRRHVYLPYLTLPTYKHRELQSIEMGGAKKLSSKMFIMHTISLSELPCPFLWMMKSTYIQEIYLAPYNVISYAMCVTSWWFIERGLFNLWSCTNMNPTYQVHAKSMFYLRNKCPL